MDQAIHKLNVGHYTLDVKVSQLMDRLSRMDGKSIKSYPKFSTANQVLPYLLSTNNPFVHFYDFSIFYFHQVSQNDACT